MIEVFNSTATVLSCSTKIKNAMAKITCVTKLKNVTTLTQVAQLNLVIPHERRSYRKLRHFDLPELGGIFEYFHTSYVQMLTTVRVTYVQRANLWETMN